MIGNRDAERARFPREMHEASTIRGLGPSRMEKNERIHVAPPAPLSTGPAERLRRALKRHEKKLWWLHSIYALSLGVFVLVFAQRGFQHARWLAVSVGAAWLLVVLLFRVFGSGSDRDSLERASTGHRVGFFAMTYTLKNLYQGMLFFLLPFYWKASTPGTANSLFVVVLALAAVVSTLDLVFDRFLLRFRALAGLFHATALFACLNLVVPALLPNTRTVTSLVVAAVIATLGFWTLHARRETFRDTRLLALAVISLFAAGGAAYGVRTFVPPVPMHLARAGVGPIVLGDGRLGMEVKTLRAEVIHRLYCVTDVVVPGGKGDRLHHVWRHDGGEIRRSGEETSRIAGPSGQVRLESTLGSQQLPRELRGPWTVDVVTEDGQLVGRTAFEVVD